MSDLEKIINKKCFQSIGLDKYFGYQTVVNIANEYNENILSQNKELVEQIIALNNTIAALKEKLLCSNCGWDNQFSIEKCTHEIRDRNYTCAACGDKGIVIE